MDSPLKWTPTEASFALPAYVKQALNALDQEGYVAYVVGGSVRDFLLGRRPKDHDIATNATVDEICRIFPTGVTVGKKFGVIKLPCTDENNIQHILEIATFRKDGEYKNHRHPESVEAASPVEDAMRRDFTVNALFYDAKTQQILDPTGGLEDLKRKTVRAIGDPIKRFKEDALRLLRAVRFSAQLEFDLDPKTSEAVKEQAKLIRFVSAERIRDELNLTLQTSRPHQALQTLSLLGILKLILPEIEQLKGKSFSSTGSGDLWSHMLKVLEFLSMQEPIRSVEVSWAAFLIHSTDHAPSILKRFKFSKGEIETVMRLLADRGKFKDVFQMREASLKRFVSVLYFDELLKLHRAEAVVTDGDLAAHEFCSRLRSEYLKNPDKQLPKLISGEDLIQLGLKPGPRFTEILQTVEDLTLEGKLRTKEEALEYVLKAFVI